MPYFIYKISPPARLTHLETRDRYQDARALVRQLRADQPSDDEHQYRLVFAGNQSAAEKLLSRPRDERVIGED